MDVAWIALVGTLCGGAGLKIIENVLARGGKKIDTATVMREELRRDLKTARDDVHLLEKELDTWKEKYFQLLQEHLDIKSYVAHNRPVQNEGRDTK